MFKYLILFACILFVGKPLTAQTDKITWYSFEDAAKLNAQLHKKVFIDIFTEWCGWCKVLDKSTFTNPVIIKIMNDNFIAVKLDAERKDTVYFNGYAFINPNPTGYRSPHQLASSMLKGRMSYPSMVYMDDSMRIITTVQSYLKPTELEPILEYIAQDKYLTMTYDSFKLSYKVLSSDDIVEKAAPPVILNKVVFDAGQSKINTSAYTQLDSVVSSLKSNEAMKIEIGGYTDNVGDESSNKKLSESRAKAVYDYFKSKGIDESRMVYAGYGSKNPVAENATADGQKKNRRIEIKILKK